MKKIEVNQIKNYNENYEKNIKCKIMQNVLYSNPIDTSIKSFNRKKEDLHQFEIDIKTLSCTNQHSSGRCWIFAGLNVLREIISKKYNIDDFELSQSFVSFYDRFEKINYLLEAIIELKEVNHDDRTLTTLLGMGVQDGGQWDMFVSIIKKYGVCPINVMDDTYQSDNTRQMNYCINTNIKRFAAFVHKNKENVALIQAEKEKLLEKLYQFMCTCLGKPVEEFDFEYVDKDGKYHLEQGLTPKTFFDQYIGVDLDDYVSIINAPTVDKPYHNMFTVKYLGNVVGGNDIHYLNLPIEEFKELCLTQLKNGEPTWFGCDCSKFGDRQNGIWDDTLFDYESAFDFNLNVEKDEMLDYYVSAMNHAMVFTGVSFKNGKVTKWKVENSWGTDHANKGYYLMTDHWFDNFVYQAVIHKKYLNDSQKECLNKKLIELEPWDPMGTLAD